MMTHHKNSDLCTIFIIKTAPSLSLLFPMPVLYMLKGKEKLSGMLKVRMT